MIELPASPERRPDEPPARLVRAVIFDLDGTLTDPFEGITACFRHALEKMGVPAPPAAALRDCIGPPIRESFSTFLGSSADRDIERAVAHYRARYAETGFLENELYPAIPALLADLRGRGCTLYVATSKLQSVARRITSHFGINGSFAGVFGADPDGTLDDKRELLAHLLAVSGLDPSACAMVGDRKFDIEAGRTNGCTTVGLTYGYGSREELEEAGADFICASPGEIAGLPLFAVGQSGRV